MPAYENQHFVPVFYSRRWAGPDKQLIRCVVEHGKFEAKLRGPSAVGVSRNLWSLTGVHDGRLRFTVEKDFFSADIDSKASLVAQQMIDLPGKPLSEPQQIAWSRFLVSLQYRNPIVLGHHIDALADQVIDDPDRPPDAFGAVPVNRSNMRALVLQAKVGRRQESERFYANRFCSVVEIQDAPFGLLTSDWPLQRIRNAYGENFPDSYVLPLSPNRLFLAAGTQADRDHWQRLNANQLVRTVNAAVTGSFLHDVWASDTTQLKYIERRMRSRGPFQIEKLLKQTI